MKNQVLSILQMQHLKELGVDTSKASAIIYKISETETYCGYAREVILIEGYVEDYIDKVETFTLQDIIELLPKEFKDDDYTYLLTMYINVNTWTICYSMSDEFDYHKEFESESLLDAAYQMLCWCAENGQLKGGEK